MPVPADCREKVLACLRGFLQSSGRQDVAIEEKTDLMTGVGMTSDEGIDFVLDLCAAFNFDFPGDFNPVVHPDGTRGRRVGELIRAVASLVPTEAAT